MATKSFIKTIGSKGLLADYNTSGKKLQTELTAGDNITIDGNTISSDQVFVATYGTTTYQEIKDAYDAGKICTVFKDKRYYYIKLIDTASITFASSNGKDTLYSLTVSSADSWSTYTCQLQSKLTFDSAPTDGSNNPVTSDGIKTAINAKADGNNSVAIFDAYMRRMNESTGWRRLAYKQFNYTNTNLNALFRLYLFGGNNDHIGLGDLFVNIRFSSSGSAPELRACYLMEDKPLNTLVKVKVIGVAGNAVVELWFRPMTFSMLTLTCLGNGLDVSSRTKDWTFGKYLDANDPEPIEDVANNIYVFSGSKRRIQTSIDNPTNGNLVIMDAKGLVKDSGKATSDFATKAALDSRVPAPTSTTGTQVLKCIDGVVQWVTE